MTQRKRYVIVGSDDVIAGTGNSVFTYEDYDTTPAFLSGGVASSVPAYLLAGTNTSDSQSAFLSGTQTYTRQVAYQVVDTTDDDVDDTSNELVVATLDTPASKLYAYLEGESAGTQVDDSTPAFLYGRPVSFQSAYLKGHIPVSSSISAFTEGFLASTPAYLAGVERSNQSAFTEGALGLFNKTLKITIDKDEVAATETNFPVLIKLRAPNDAQDELRTVANGGYVNNTTSGGAGGATTVPCDLVFAADRLNETVYEHEIEYYDPTTGEIWAHVLLPTLSAATDTDVYINFGESSITISQEQIHQVWIDDYVLVLHLHESSGTRYDSTIYQNHGTAVGSPPNINTTPGHKGIDLDDDGDYIEIPWNSVFEVQDDFSLMVWLRSNVSSQSGSKFVFDLGGYDDKGFGIFQSSQWMYSYYGGEFQASDVTVGTSTTWLHGLVYDGDDVRFIRDYYTRSQDLNVTETPITHNPIRIGCASDSVGSYFDGFADEVRLSSKSRADTYYETIHRMSEDYYQSTAFITIGTVEDVVQTDSTPAFLEGYTAGKSATPAFLAGTDTAKSSTEAFLKSGGESNSSQAAFLRGPTAADSSQSAYLAGPTPASSSVSAWLDGDVINRSSVPAWLWADWPPDPNVAESSMPGYLEGDGTFPFSDDWTGSDGDEWAEVKWDTGYA